MPRLRSPVRIRSSAQNGCPQSQRLRATSFLIYRGIEVGYSFHQPVMSVQVLGITQGQGLRRSIGCTRFGGSQSTKSCSVPQIHAPVFCSSPLLLVCLHGRSQLVCPSRLSRGVHNARFRNYRLLPSKIQPPRLQDREGYPVRGSLAWNKRSAGWTSVVGSSSSETSPSFGSRR